MNGGHRKSITFGPVIVSIILPGLGQMAMGKKALGLSFMLSALSSVGVVLYLFVTGYLRYMDIVLSLDLAVQEPPNVWEVMHIKEIFIFFGITIFVYLASIIHAAVAGRK